MGEVCNFLRQSEPTQDEKLNSVLDDLLLNVAFMFGNMGMENLHKAVEALKKQGEIKAAENIYRHSIAILEQLQILMKGEKYAPIEKLH